MYSGASTDAIPTPTPPMIRAGIKIAKLGGMAENRAEMKNKKTRYDQNRLSPEPVAERSRDRRADDATHERGTAEPADLKLAQMELFFDESKGAGNHGRVKTKQQSSQRRHKTDARQIKRAAGLRTSDCFTTGCVNVVRNHDQSPGQLPRSFVQCAVPGKPPQRKTNHLVVTWLLSVATRYSFGRLSVVKGPKSVRLGTRCTRRVRAGRWIVRQGHQRVIRSKELTTVIPEAGRASFPEPSL